MKKSQKNADKSKTKEKMNKLRIEEDKNPMHYCLNCNKYIGARGFCSTDCQDEWCGSQHKDFEEKDTDVTAECTVIIEHYSDTKKNGLLLKHKENRLAMIKLKATKRSYELTPECFIKLWDINKGYDLDIDEWGNFKVWYNPKNSKICPTCGHRTDE